MTVDSTLLSTGKNESSARRYRLGLAIASAVLVPLLVVILVEVGLRICNVGFRTDLLVPCTIHGQAAACYNLFFPAPFFPPGMIKSPQVYAIPAQKASNAFRIFVLGESAAMGDPDPAYGFSRYLEVMLRERYPSISFEVINTGSVAINSHVLLPIARQLAEQKPDVFMIYSGNNEVVGPYGPGTALTSSGRVGLSLIRASIYARSTRLGQLLTNVGTQKRQWRGMEMFLDKQVRASSPQMDGVYGNFERNLKDTIDAAQKSGAHVIVSTVATNLRDCAPFGSLHKENLSADELRSWSSLFEQGSTFEQQGSYDSALKAYSSAAGIDGEYAELEFRIARLLGSLGKNDEAKLHFSRARDLDTLRFRADSKINQINRMAASLPGVDLLDADALLSNESRSGVIGSEMIYEHVHLTPQGNYVLARAMFAKIADRLSAENVQPTAKDVPSEADCERLLALTGYDRARLTQEMLRRLQEPPFTNQLNHSEQMLALMARVSDKQENPNDTVSQYQWAIEKKPDDRVLRSKFGQFLFPYNQNAAAQQLLMAQPWDGFPVFLPDGKRIR